MDTATANNGWYLPLVYFDPIRIESLFPPRVYLQDIYLPDGITVGAMREIAPPESVKLDDTTLFKGAYYVEINSIKTEAEFKEWARTPLGEYDGDVEFHEVYESVISPVNKGPLTGSIPGYWNFYGTMQYSYDNVSVTSIALGNDGQREFFAGERGIAEISRMVGSELTLDQDIHDRSTTSATMVDCLPTMAMYTQIFHDQLTMKCGGEVFMKGNPLKASLRWLNPFRVVNANMPFSGSGAFVCSIPVEDIEGGMDSPIMRMFSKYGDQTRRLKGVYYYQAISEIKENRTIDYRRDGSIRNPAYGTVSGRLCPWYDGDMASFTLDRQMVGAAPFIMKKNEDYAPPVSMMSPLVFRFLKDRNALQLDFLNNFPLQIEGDGEGPFSPDPREETRYSVYDLGDLTIKLNPPPGMKGPSVALGAIPMNENARSREQLHADGGMFIIPIPDIPKIDDMIQNWDLAVYAMVDGKEICLMTESPVVIMSDQAGLYADQGADPTRGYRSYTEEKEPCILRIIKRGVPVTDPMEMTIVEYKMSSSGALRTDAIYRIESYKDGDSVSFDTAGDKNAIYSFLPYRTHNVPKQGYPGAVVQTGFFVNLKVLPRHDYGPYLDPTHPDFPQKVTFELLYEEIFKKYSLLTPTMNFHKERFDNPWGARELARRMDIKQWDKSWYMPVTRDLSADQLELLRKWEAQEVALEAQELRREETHSDIAHAQHLSNSAFFKR